MITSPNRRGRPKGERAQKTSAERQRTYRKKLRDSGGATISLDLEKDELQLLETIKNQWGLPLNASNADVIKAMAVVLNGHTFIANGIRIKAHIEIV